MNDHFLPAGVRIANPLHLYIGGSWVAPLGGGVIEVVCPDTANACGATAEAGPGDMDAAVAAAREAFDNGPWPRLSPGERAAYLGRLADGLEKRSPELCAAWTAQIGALVSQTEKYTAEATDAIRKYIKVTEKFDFISKHQSKEAAVALVVREPVGVVACIAPWNFPYDIMINKVAPALLAGCTVIVKPAPETPLEAYILAEVAHDIGLPAGVLNLVPGHRDASDHLVQNAGVDKVAFTGSTLAGQRIGEVCGRRIARQTLELGGKSPVIVLDDADLDDAAHRIVETISLMCGQVCATLSRVLVARHRHDAFASVLADKLGRVKVGPSTDPTTEMGPIALKRQLDRVESYIARGIADGAKLVCGGKRIADLGKGFFIQPTLFANVDNTSAIAQDEIFGPVLSLIAYEDEEDAIRLANATRYGLNGAIITSDSMAAYRIARRLRAGTLAQGGLRTDFNLPYGGAKQSGIGREGGPEGLMEYLETKAILLDNDVLGAGR
jgi:aldehyde dehydrogenase (NAD+)